MWRDDNPVIRVDGENAKMKKFPVKSAKSNAVHDGIKPARLRPANMRRLDPEDSGAQINREATNGAPGLICVQYILAEFMRGNVICGLRFT